VLGRRLAFCACHRNVANIHIAMPTRSVTAHLGTLAICDQAFGHSINSMTHLCQAALDDFRHIRGVRGHWRVFSSQDFQDEGALVVCIKWVPLHTALVKHNAERPHVPLLIVRLVLTQLRAKVVRRAHNGFGEAGVRAQDLRLRPTCAQLEREGWHQRITFPSTAERCCTSALLTLATPMSPSLTFSASSRKTFRLLMSRCKILRECMWLSPSRICSVAA
jgi:hypothetical protein